MDAEAVEIVEYRVVGVPDPGSEHEVAWVLTVSPETAEKWADEGHDDVRVEQRTVRTCVSEWRPVDGGRR